MSILSQCDLLDGAWNRFPSFISRFYRIGPFVVALSFATPSLVDKITKAFEHLEVKEATSPDLEIRIWDSSKTEDALPPLDWNLIFRNGYQGYCVPPIYLHYADDIDTLSVLNTERKRAYYVIRNGDALSWLVYGSPLQTILHPWLRERGMQLAHSAAIGNGKSAIVLTGKSGSGKSTTTLTCVRAGCDYLGEDYLILSPEGEVYSIYQSAKWKEHTRKLFPFYEEFIKNREMTHTQKALLYYGDFFPSQIGQSLPARAIVSLKVGQTSQPVLRRYEMEFALRDLMLSTLRQLPFYHSKTMDILKDFVGKVARYELVLGQNIEENIQAVKSLFL